jgi:hypothetical protein
MSSVEFVLIVVVILVVAALTHWFGDDPAYFGGRPGLKPPIVWALAVLMILLVCGEFAGR